MSRERTSTSRRFHLILTGCALTILVWFAATYAHIAGQAHGPQPILPAKKWWACTEQVVTQPTPADCLRRARF